jgi:hypothetical protein
MPLSAVVCHLRGAIAATVFLILSGRNQGFPNEEAFMLALRPNCECCDKDLRRQFCAAADPLRGEAREISAVEGAGVQASGLRPGGVSAVCELASLQQKWPGNLPGHFRFFARRQFGRQWPCGPRCRQRPHPPETVCRF